MTDVILRVQDQTACEAQRTLTKLLGLAENDE